MGRGKGEGEEKKLGGRGRGVRREDVCPRNAHDSDHYYYCLFLFCTSA